MDSPLPQASDAHRQAFPQSARQLLLVCGRRSRPRGWEPGKAASAGEGTGVHSRRAFEEQRVGFRVARRGFGAGTGSLWGPTLGSPWI